MTQRRAPKGGYSFSAKQEYRERFWAAASKQLGSCVAYTHVVILPSTEGAEIPLLLSLGFQESHIHAVDANAALIATAPWREKYPAVNRYGSDLPRAMERISEKGVSIGAANLDLCGCFSTAMVDTIRGVVAADAFTHTAVIGLTMLKGREETSTIAALRLLNEQLQHNAMPCDIRLDAALREFGKIRGLRMQIVDSGEYRSQTQSMVWACVAVATPEVIKEEERQRMAPLSRRISRLWGYCKEEDQLDKSFGQSGRYRRMWMEVEIADNPRKYPHIRGETMKHYRCLADEYHKAERRLEKLKTTIPLVRAALKYHGRADMPFPEYWNGRRSIGYSCTAAQMFFSNIARYPESVVPFSDWVVSKPSGRGTTGTLDVALLDVEHAA